VPKGSAADTAGADATGDDATGVEDIVVDVAGVEADVAGWAWVAATGTAQEGLTGQTCGIPDSTEPARTDARAPGTELGAASIQA
jgi:hypothetical protein